MDDQSGAREPFRPAGSCNCLDCFEGNAVGRTKAPHVVQQPEGPEESNYGGEEEHISASNCGDSPPESVQECGDVADEHHLQPPNLTLPVVLVERMDVSEQGLVEVDGRIGEARDAALRLEGLDGGYVLSLLLHS